MDAFSLYKTLNTIRDPAVFMLTMGTVFYLNRFYVTKAAHKEAQELIKDQVSILEKDMWNQVTAIHKNYVSKDKLSDVVSPIEGQLRGLRSDLKDMKDLLIDIIKERK